MTGLLESPPSPGFHPCGENGEYHTFVLGGPLFGGRIRVALTKRVFRDGYGFVDLEGAEFVPRGRSR